MKQAYKKIIAFSLLSFGAAVAMNSDQQIPKDVDDECATEKTPDDECVTEKTPLVENGYKKFVEKQIKDGHENNDPYAVLGISKKASDAEIGYAFRALSALYHPDKGSCNNELMDKITNAKNAIDSEKTLRLGLAYGIQKLAVRSVASLARNDVKLLTDQIAMYVVIGLLRTNIAAPIRRFFIHSDDELEKLQEELHVLSQQREYNDHVIKKMSAQVDVLKTLKLEIKTQKLNEQLREKEKEKALSREKFLQGFGSLHIPPIQFGTASKDDDKKNDSEIEAINDQIFEQSQSNENIPAAI